MVKPHCSNPRARRLRENGEQKLKRDQKRQRRAVRDLENQRIEDLALALMDGGDVRKMLRLLGDRGTDWVALSYPFARDLAAAIVASLDRQTEA